MNDGVRRSLLAAKIAQMQAEDERELALGLRSVESMGRPGWSAVSPENRSTTSAEIQGNRSVLDSILQRAQGLHGSMQQDGAGQA